MAPGFKAMTMRWLSGLATVLVVALATMDARARDESTRSGSSTEKDATRTGKDDAGPSLSMTPAVACDTIEGYEDYKVLPNAALTSEEKLLVYFRPLGYAVEVKDGQAHIHLEQDGQVRRRGQKKVLLVKNHLLEYDWKGRAPAAPIYLKNLIGLKNLPPGDYEFDIILHDKLAPGET